MSDVVIDVAECLACNDISCGAESLQWALDHTTQTGHPTSTRSAA